MGTKNSLTFVESTSKSQKEHQKWLLKNVVNANAKPSKQLKEKLPNVIVDMKMLNTKDLRLKKLMVMQLNNLCLESPDILPLLFIDIFYQANFGIYFYAIILIIKNKK